MILGPSVLELSSGNHLVDGPTDMCKAIYPLFFEGGINIDTNILDIPNFGNKLIQIRRMGESTRLKWVK